MKTHILIHLSILFFASFTALASGGGGGGGGGGFSGGGGGGGGPRPIDREKVALGQKVFSGRADLSPKIVSRDLYQRQARTLVRLQKKVNRSKSSARGKSFMPRELAGRMTTKQLSALSYYVKITFDD